MDGSITTSSSDELKKLIEHEEANIENLNNGLQLPSIYSCETAPIAETNASVTINVGGLEYEKGVILTRTSLPYQRQSQHLHSAVGHFYR